LVTTETKVIYLSKTYAGRVHDKKICDKEPLKLKSNTELLQDSGFQGHWPHRVKVRQPKKRTKNKNLTEREKQANKRLARVRVKVEHAISAIKRLRMVKDVYRNRKPKVIDICMQIACGVHNLRLAA